MYLLSPLSLLALPALKRLPRVVWGILALYAVSQQLPALFSPEPLLATALALGRTLLMFGLMGVGVTLRSSDRLRPLAIGLAIIYATAVVYSLLSGTDFLVSRLTHPYMTSIALGLAGAYGVWTALFVGGRLWWRLPLGLVALGVLLFSGGRGPLAAALAGCVAGFVIRRGLRTGLLLLLGAGLLAGGFYVGDRLGISAITRFDSLDTTGRDIVWYNTLTVIKSQPLSGVGSYRLGKYLAPPSEGCPVVSPTASDGSTGCPTWIRSLGSPWLIAHNLTLQQLAETGPVGLLGLLALLSVVVVATFTGRNSFGMAVIAGMIVATLNDNTLLVPSPYFAELFWVIAGMQLTNIKELNVSSSGFGVGLALLFSLPLVITSFENSFRTVPASAHLSFLDASAQASVGKPYTVFAKFDVPTGLYRSTLNSCQTSCVTLETNTFIADATGSPVLTFETHLPVGPVQRIELRLLTGKASFNISPLGTRTWTVNQ